MSKQLHQVICEELTEMYAMKNEDYGNSFSKRVEEFGYISAIIRLADKYERAKELVINNGKHKVKEEKLEDTLMDLANYSIMLLMEIRKKEGEQLQYEL